MTLTTAAAPVQRATILATIESVRRRGSESRVLGIRAPRSLDGVEGLADQHGEPVAVLWCPSALAMWDALTTWDGKGWLVLLSDCEEEELGSGLLARLAQNRLHRPDPWESVKLRFRATRLDRALLEDSRPSGSAIPEALLRLEPHTARGSGWPAARAGVLGRDVVYGAVARHLLGLDAETLDGPAVLEASLAPELTARLADLRAGGGDPLADAALRWLTGRLGPGAAIAQHVFASGAADDLLPLTLALDHIVTAAADHPQESALAGARLEARLPDAFRGATLPGATGPAADQLRSLAELARTTLHGMLTRPAESGTAVSVLRRAEKILRAEQAPSLIATSELLPGGLSARQRTLAAALTTDPATVELSWRQIQNHPLTPAGRGRDTLHQTLQAAVRLDRWLSAAPTRSTASGVGRLERAVQQARTHALDGAWAESALGDLLQGADDPEIASGLSRLAEQVLNRRRELDRAFAADLTPLAHGQTLPDGEDVHYLEDVLPGMAMPLARSTPTTDSPRRGGALVLLVDGMSAAAATDLADSILDVTDRWREITPRTARHRATALALLPTLTEHSRTSFFTGRPVSGAQQQEREGIAALARSAGLAGTTLFHKADFGEQEAGNALTARITSAIADVDSTPLVACVLNTIDDALDRSDPGGTRWTTADVRYLRPLLLEADRAGRTVILTGDHGHVVERNGRLERQDDATSARSRPASGAPAGPDEILVEGRRVLGGDDAILAVDEDLRYTSRRAGYHGGASLSETAVPVLVLRPRPLEDTEAAWTAELPDGWVFAGDQRPLWWSIRPETAPAQHVETRIESLEQDGMLDLYGNGAPTSQPREATGLGTAIIATPRYADQKKGLRRTPPDEAVAALVDELAAAPSTRLPLSRVSQLLATPAARTGRVAGVVAQLLNVEGFEVLRLEDDTAILDATLAREQFEVHG